MSKIAVVILNWNGRCFLEKFLPSVINHSREYAEIIVADNHSSDDSLQYLKEHHPEIRTIQNTSNSGFAGGYNYALKEIDADYYILLNSDVEVTKNWISPLINFMENDDSIAVCQPKIKSYNEKNKFEYAGAAGGFIDKYGYPFCRGRLFQHIETDLGQYDDACEIFWASGACFFIKSKAFHEANGFDIDFFAHMEEIDLCWRLKNMGYKIMYCPDSTIYHVGGGTLPKTSSRKTYFNFRNDFFLLYKNLPKNRLWKMFCSRLFLDGLAGFKFLLQGGYKDFWAVIRAHLSFYKNYPKLKEKRKQLTQNKVSMIYWSNVAFEHYFWRVKKYSEFNLGKFSK